jgi:hypothetical protein
MDDNRVTRDEEIRAEYVLRARMRFWAETQQTYDAYETEIKHEVAHVTAGMDPEVGRELEAYVLGMLAEALSNVRSKGAAEIEKGFCLAAQPDMD